MGSKRKRSAQEAAAAQPPAKKQQKPKKAAVPKPAPLPLDSSPFVDNPKGPELKREVELYDILGSEDIIERLNAASAIVSGLLGGEGVQESTLQRHLERRLFRGLASGRKAARLGYSTVLAEIISQLFGENALAEAKYPGLSFDTVMGFLIAKTKPDGDLSGQEQKDHFIGLLFGIKSFVRAKVLFNDDRTWSTVLEQMIDLEKKKPWIREEVGSVIVEALAQMSQTQAEKTLEQLENAKLAVTPEGVGIWLTAKAQFPDLKSPVKPWGSTGNPLDRLQSLAKALKESSTDEGGLQPGNWNHHLHFAWTIVLDQFAAALKNKKSGIKSDFENFWKVAVDENLFSATASNERKYWGFLLFQKVLQNSDVFSKVLPSIFSKNLMRCLVNHLQAKDRNLHILAQQSVQTMIRVVESDSSKLGVVLSGLLSGLYNFDRATKTKTVEKLLSQINEFNAKEVVETLVHGALNVTSSDAAKEAEIRRTLLGDYLLTAGRKNIDGSWIEEVVLPTMASIAYGNESKCSPPLSEKTRVLFRNRLTSVFGHLLISLEGFKYPCQLLQDTIPSAVEMDADIAKARDSAKSTMVKILKKEKKATPEEKPVLQALALLYSLVIFQLYNGESEAISVLEELKICYEKLVKNKITDDSDMDVSEVLVQLLLSFISKPSALLRKVTQHVFQVFIGDMTEGGLKLMVEILESGESLRGQQELFDQEDDEQMEMDEDAAEVENGNDDEDDELDSDVEVVDIKALPARMGNLKPHLDKSDDEDGDEEDDDDEDDGEEEDEDDEDASNDDDDETKKLEAALALALGTHKLDATNGATADADDDEDSDADMTDSEMMALDEKLVEIFSQRKKIPNKKQEQKDAKETMVNFKSRVLDLLEIYVKKQATNPLALDLLIPLLCLMRTTKTKSLANKAHDIILAFGKFAKKESGSLAAAVDIDVDEQLERMKAIHVEATKDPSHTYCKAASSASLFVASTLYRADKDNYDEICHVYGGSIVAWGKQELKMHGSFYHDFINWCGNWANS